PWNTQKIFFPDLEPQWSKVSAFPFIQKIFRKKPTQFPTKFYCWGLLTYSRISCIKLNNNAHCKEFFFYFNRRGYNRFTPLGTAIRRSCLAGQQQLFTKTRKLSSNFGSRCLYRTKNRL